MLFWKATSPRFISASTSPIPLNLPKFSKSTPSKPETVPIFVSSSIMLIVGVKINWSSAIDPKKLVPSPTPSDSARLEPS